MNEKVICPWCGEEMGIPISDECSRRAYDRTGFEWNAFIPCVNNQCFAEGPVGYGHTKQEAIESACAAAMRRPENKPLLRSELPLVSMPCWIFRERSSVEPCLLLNYDGAGTFEMLHAHGRGFLYQNDYGKHWIAWGSEPTPADIAAYCNQ